MSYKGLEIGIIEELRIIAKNNKLKGKDLMEWSTSPVKAQEGETLYFLPGLKVYCAVKVPSKDR